METVLKDGMSKNIRRPALRSDFEGPGYLSGIKAPPDSCWKSINARELWRHHMRVRHSSGAHELSWIIREKNQEPLVLFALQQKTIDGFVATRTKQFAARPVFSLMNEMEEVFGAGRKKFTAPASTAFERCRTDMPGLREFQEGIEDMQNFLVDEMGQWLRPDDNVKKLIERVYLAVSGDVMHWLSQPKIRPAGPRPGQPGN